MASSWYDDLGDLGEILGKYAASSARGRQTDADLQQGAEGLKLRAPSVWGAQGAQGDILANSQDAQITGLPSYVTKPNLTGGLRPSMLSPETRANGKQMARQALLSQLKGPDQFNPPDASLGETLAGGAGTAATLLKAGAPLLSKLPGAAGSLFGGGAAGAIGTEGIGGLEAAMGGMGASDVAAGGGASAAGGGGGAAAFLGSGAGQAALGIGLPLALAKIGDLAGWWGDNAYDPNVIEDPRTTPGQYVAKGAGKMGGIGSNNDPLGPNQGNWFDDENEAAAAGWGEGGY